MLPQNALRHRGCSKIPLGSRGIGHFLRKTTPKRGKEHFGSLNKSENKIVK